MPEATAMAIEIVSFPFTIKFSQSPLIALLIVKYSEPPGINIIILGTKNVVVGVLIILAAISV